MVVTAALLFLCSAPAAAQTTFTVSNTNDVGAGSLRQAILDANANPGADIIDFNISGAGPHTIQPASALPTISDPVVIDGTTEPDFAGTPIIELDGTNAGSVNGVEITAANSTVRGLVINRFALNGVLISGSGATGNLVEGNFIGTNVAGSSALANLGNGIRITSSANLVGGSLVAARNLISGNHNDGVQISGPGATGNRVEGNYIGVDATGTAAIGNGIPEPDPTPSAAVYVIEGASQNIIGGIGITPGTCDGPCNVISGNNRTGVAIQGEGAHNTVQGNFIGNDASGTQPLGNARWGVALHIGASHNTIVSNRVVWNGHDGVIFSGGASQNILGGIGTTPGTCDGPCNVIAFNATTHDIARGGVRLTVSAGGNAILGNSIFSNLLGLGIDLGARGVTPNDAGDVDTGGNNVQNFPVLTAALKGSTIIEGTLNSTPGTEFRLEFFSNSACDPMDHGEGESFLGSTMVTTDGGGDVSFTVTFPPTLAAGTFITATATDASNNTSEFSQCAAVVDFTIAASPDSAVVPRGQAAVYTVTIEADGGTFDGDIVVSCSNLPAESICDFSPASVSPGAGAVVSTLTVSTTDPATPTGTATFTIAGTSGSIERSNTTKLTVTDFIVEVAPDPVTVTQGQAATYTVTVMPVGGTFDDPVSLSCSGLPTETSCVFSDSVVTPGTSPATSTLTVSTTAGATPIGSSAFSVVAVSGALQDSVTATLIVADFTVAVSPTSATVARGQSASYTVTVSPGSGAVGEPVTLSCSGLPAGASCSFSPSIVTPNASTVTSTLTVSTNALTASLMPTLAPQSDTPTRTQWYTLLFLGAPGLTLAGLVLRRGQSKKPSMCRLLGLVLLSAGLFSACGGDSTSPPEPITSTFTITGTSGSLEHSTTATLIVQ